MSLPLTAHAAVEINGRRYDTLNDRDLFLSLDVELTTGMTSEATWRVSDPDYAVLDRYASGEGVAQLAARVWLWFGDEAGAPVFEGLLTSAEIDDDAAATVLRFFDHGYPMRQVQQTEYHKNLTDVGIIEKLAGQHDLRFSGPGAIELERHVSHIQKGETDWQHAQDCAERAGLALYVRGRTLYAKEAARFSAPVASLVNRRDFRLLLGTNLKFRLPENREGKPYEVEVRGRGHGGTRLAGRSKAQRSRRGRRRVEVRRDPGARTRKGLDARAQARKDLEREHAFVGALRILPRFTGRRPDARDTIELLGIGKLFSGKYLCERVSHSFAPGELLTTIDVYRDIKVG